MRTFITILALSLMIIPNVEARGGRGGGGRRGGGGHNVHRSPSMSRISHSPYSSKRPSRNEVSQFLKNQPATRERQRPEYRKDFGRDVRKEIGQNRPNQRDWYTRDFWDKHPHHRPPYYDHHHNWWRGATVVGITGWLGWRSAPIYYGYYDNPVTYQQPIEDEYVEQKSSSGEWLPLGVFALSRDKGLTTTPNLYLQLALNKKGTLSGTYYNALTDQTYEAEGMVDEKSQRAAWKVVDHENAPILETGIYDLTQSEAPVCVHFLDGRSEEMVLIRMEETNY